MLNTFLVPEIGQSVIAGTSLSGSSQGTRTQWKGFPGSYWLAETSLSMFAAAKRSLDNLHVADTHQRYFGCCSAVSCCILEILQAIIQGYQPNKRTLHWSLRQLVVQAPEITVSVLHPGMSFTFVANLRFSQILLPVETVAGISNNAAPPAPM